MIKGHNKKRKSQRAILLASSLLVFTLFLLDQYTKNLALSSLSLGESRPVFETAFFSFFWTLVTNKGAAWGVFAFSPYLLLSIRLVVVIALSLLMKRTQHVFSKLCIAAIMSGALSNILDFFLYGAVIDFIHLRFGSYDYPVFNLADSSIFIGTIGLILASLRHKE